MRQTAAILALLASSVYAQQAAWGQCGGIGWTGATTCVSGYSCSFINSYYSQCVPSTAATTTAAGSSGSPTGTPVAKGKLKYVGVDESCAEWGTNMPGTCGIEYTFPSTSAIDTLISEGLNIFRVPFAMERMAQGSMTATLNAGYLANYSTVINHITSKGAKAIIDPHNYGRYNNAIITDTKGFQTFWQNLATQFKSNANVIFDTNNEYNTMDQTLVLNLNQAAINGIRAAGATSQTIYIEGNNWTGASTWNTTNDNLKTLTDPQNKLVFEMHLYLDSDGSGTDPSCVSADVGVQRVEGATAWLRANGKQGIIGETAGGQNTVCLAAITDLMNHLAANSDVWQGALWWAAGPWWGTSTQYTFEPPTGTAYTYYKSVWESYI